MTPGDPPTGTLDFRALDFERLWKGRERTTEVERRLISGFVQEGDTRRLLEVGPGAGRITPVLLASGREYVGVDVTQEFLVPLRTRWPERSLWLGADLTDLPFQDATFTGAVVVRVYNFLVDPYAALRELYRVLVPGGWLVISYFSSPSLAAAWDGLSRRLREPGSGGRPEGGSRLPSRSDFRAIVARAGFTVRTEAGVGLEDLQALRWLPAGVFLGLSRSFGRRGVLPHHFVALEKPGRAPADLPPLSECLACPACGAPIVGDRSGLPSYPRCLRCGRDWSTPSGVPDLRPRSAGAGPPAEPVVQVRAR